VGSAAEESLRDAAFRRKRCGERDRNLGVTDSRKFRCGLGTLGYELRVDLYWPTALQGLTVEPRYPARTIELPCRDPRSKLDDVRSLSHFNIPEPLKLQHPHFEFNNWEPPLPLHSILVSLIWFTEPCTVPSFPRAPPWTIASSTLKFSALVHLAFRAFALLSTQVLFLCFWYALKSIRNLSLISIWPSSRLLHNCEVDHFVAFLFISPVLITSQTSQDQHA